MAVRPFTHIMRKPLMTIGIKEISEDQYNHFFYKWLYTYGGTSDVKNVNIVGLQYEIQKTLQEFINEYDSDLCGDVDVYDSSICPCIICLDGKG